jgi:serine/threonine protein kinase
MHTLAGNVAHLSPELFYQYRQGAFDQKTIIKYSPFKNDVYGLGVVLFYLCTFMHRGDRSAEA